MHFDSISIADSVLGNTPGEEKTQPHENSGLEVTIWGCLDSSGTLEWHLLLAVVVPWLSDSRNHTYKHSETENTKLIQSTLKISKWKLSSNY